MENETSNSSAATEPQAPAHKNTLMAVLSYIGILVIVPFITSKEDPFVKFHLKQGLVLFIIEVATWVLGMMVWALWPILQIVNLAVVILAIIGIINAVKGEEKELPLVGKFSSHFKF